MRWTTLKDIGKYHNILPQSPALHAEIIEFVCSISCWYQTPLETCHCPRVTVKQETLFPPFSIITAAVWSLHSCMWDSIFKFFSEKGKTVQLFVSFSAFQARQNIFKEPLLFLCLMTTVNISSRHEKHTHKKIELTNILPFLDTLQASSSLEGWVGGWLLPILGLNGAPENLQLLVCY